MKKEILVVPRGIRYVSDWKEYSLLNYPFPHIINKHITGCGFTEYCLTNDLNTVLCSPRKILLENKESQHKGDVFYFRNEFEDCADFDRDLVSVSKKVDNNTLSKVSNIENNTISNLIYDKLYKLKSDLLSYIELRKYQGLPIKILVTYDSFHLVREFIETNLSICNFQIVIDEFQSIFTDSRFKSDTELGFLGSLSDVKRVCFVSATPMLDPYLEMLDEFKDLPYFEFDWAREDASRTISPSLSIHFSNSLISSAKSIVETYLSGNYSVYSYRDPLGRICEIPSKEAVLYFNSVKNICDLIRKCGLTPDNTNVLCARTDKNSLKIQKAFRDSCGRKDGGIGYVPKKGEPHKMFTLCTRTVYLGADFYSTNARSFVFSDANIDSLAVDISLDLPQILGRQRLDINPWKNCAEVYFKSLLVSKSISKESFDYTLEKKTAETNKLIQACYEVSDANRSTLIWKLETSIPVNNYKSDYFSVDTDKLGNKFPRFNNLVKIAEMRAFDIQQVDYKDRFTIFNALSKEENNLELDKIEKFINVFDSFLGFQEKLRYLCEEIVNFERDEIGLLLSRLPVTFVNYFTILGPDRCRSLRYRSIDLKREYDRLINNQTVDVDSQILSRFNVGSKYSLSDVKLILADIFKDSGYKESPKATILGKYFDLKTVKFTVKDESGDSIKVNGYLILGKKNN